MRKLLAGMILLGLCAAALALPPNAMMVGVRGTSFALTYVSTATNSTGSFTSQAISTPDQSRIVVVGVGAALTSGSISAMTIGGVSATRQVQATFTTTTNVYSEIWTAPVPGGTTATITLTFSGTSPFFDISTYALYGARSATPTATNTATSSSNTVVAASLAIPNAGAGLGMVAINAAGVTGTNWTNLTEQTDGNHTTNFVVSSASSTGAGTATRTSTGNASGSNALALAAWSP